MKINTGDKIRVHLYSFGKEIKTRSTDRVFTVREDGGKKGIDWTGEFTSLDSFSWENGAVVFEKVEEA